MTHCWRRRLVFKTKSELTIYLFMLLFSQKWGGEKRWGTEIGT